MLIFTSVAPAAAIVHRLITETKAILRNRPHARLKEEAREKNLISKPNEKCR